ncbi:hypothetical protein [Streptomyces sp. DT195]|uniref:hypothetical protein n=1 Tax=Streptomyces sp. DT195 TaxID=3393419 RepID=UPI003CE96276
MDAAARAALRGACMEIQAKSYRMQTDLDAMQQACQDEESFPRTTSASATSTSSWRAWSNALLLEQLTPSVGALDVPGSVPR